MRVGERRKLLLPGAQVADRAVHEDDRVALALLAHHRRAIRHADLMERIQRFRAFLAQAGALESASLARHSDAVVRALAPELGAVDVPPLEDLIRPCRRHFIPPRIVERLQAAGVSDVAG